jgi:hypothetical protein
MGSSYLRRYVVVHSGNNGGRLRRKVGIAYV